MGEGGCKQVCGVEMTPIKFLTSDPFLNANKFFKVYIKVVIYNYIFNIYLESISVLL